MSAETMPAGPAEGGPMTSSPNPTREERAEKLALALAEKWDEAFEKAYWRETSTFIETVLPFATALVQMGEALREIASTNCALPHMRTCPGCAGCIARAALAAYDALMKEQA